MIEATASTTAAGTTWSEGLPETHPYEIAGTAWCGHEPYEGIDIAPHEAPDKSSDKSSGKSSGAEGA